MKPNWNEIRFRASSWGELMCEPREKSAKEKGELSGTTKKALIKIYNQEVYGRKKDLVTKQMEKGKQVEEESIRNFSIVEGKMFFKNDEMLQDDDFCGHPDIFTGDNISNAEEVGDIKSSWDLDTFMPKLIEEPDKSYVAQLNVYYALTGAKGGFLAYCLTSAPPNILESEKRSLLFKMNVATEYAPEYIAAAQELEKNMVFEDIPLEERIIKIPISRDDELIQKMRNKVPIMRQWLEDFHKKHLNQYSNQLK